MAAWECAACGAQWAPGAPRCPECPSTEHVEVAEVPKILPNGEVTYEPGREPDGSRAAAAEALAAAGHGPDDVATVINVGDGEPEQVTDVPAGDAAPSPGPAAKVPPRTPPRRTPPAGG